jgi:hypothetical protein
VGRRRRVLGGGLGGCRVAIHRGGPVTVLSALASCCCIAPAAHALAQTSAGIQPSFQPYRLGASAALTLALGFGGGAEQVPAPLRRMVLRLPVGLGINLAGVTVCAKSRLRSGGTAGCPPGSLLGRGHALLKVHAGSQTLPEEATVSLFRGPNQGSDPTFEILGHGETPLDETTISTAVLQPDAAPYGSKLTVSVPPIPTLVYEPNASFSSLSLTIGNAGHRPGAHAAGAIALPRSCPAGGFPFAAAFTFADDSVASAGARLACP